ncbi:hypothetical protein, partial [Vallitalea okinawensis]|uniref:hypothetical protein n=1 Tax=Vallitalea okinawensis TaxID=2078660 RepID=UPI001300578B
MIDVLITINKNQIQLSINNKVVSTMNEIVLLLEQTTYPISIGEITEIELKNRMREKLSTEREKTILKLYSKEDHDRIREAIKLSKDDVLN